MSGKILHIGDTIRITSNNPQYRGYKAMPWVITHIARERGHGKGQHPGYDGAFKGEALVDCRGLPFSLYEYEFRVVARKGRK